MIRLLPRPRTLVATTLSYAEIEQLLERSTHKGTVVSGEYAPPEYYENLFETPDRRTAHTIRPLGVNKWMMPFLDLSLEEKADGVHITFTVRTMPYLVLASIIGLCILTLFSPLWIGGAWFGEEGAAGTGQSIAVAASLVLVLLGLVLALMRIAVRRTDRYLRVLLRRGNLDRAMLDKTVRNRMWA